MIFFRLKKLKFEVIPMIFHPRGSLYRAKELELDNNDLSDHTKQVRQTYEKIAM